MATLAEKLNKLLVDWRVMANDQELIAQDPSASLFLANQVNADVHRLRSCADALAALLAETAEAEERAKLLSAGTFVKQGQGPYGSCKGGGQDGN